MTWEQAVAAVLAIGVTALARLVNRWLPPSHEGGLLAMGVEHADTEPTAAPPPDPGIDPPPEHVEH
jgi:hypothetical protein